MKFLESILYGIVSGLCEILPVSSRAHQGILLKLFGVSEANPLLNLMIHIAVVAAIIFSCRDLVIRLRFTQQPSRKRSRRYAGRNAENRFIKNAAITLIVGLVLLTYIVNTKLTLPRITIFSFINGLLLFLTGRMMQGNKDASHMSAIDSVAVGVLGSFSVIPGISRIGVMTSFTSMRGADREKVLDWALLLSIPAVAVLALFDFFGLFTGFQAISFGLFIGYVLAMGAAFAACYFAIIIMRFLSVRTGFSGFAYYSWGVALFAFVLYLI